MSLLRNRYEVLTDTPGHLTYREGNHEYVFPVFEADGEIVIVGFPTRRRIRFFFGWHGDWRDFTASDGARVLPRLLEHFRRSGKQVRLFERGDAEGESFVFYPELFESRNRASDILDEAGFAWFSQYSSIDLLQREYGLEIAGIHEGSKVTPIAATMKAGFPQWHYSRVCHNEFGREPGWKYSIHMFPPSCGGSRCVDTE